MNNFERIKQYDIKQFAEYIRTECLNSHFNGVVLDIDTIISWLKQESEE